MRVLLCQSALSTNTKRTGSKLNTQHLRIWTDLRMQRSASGSMTRLAAVKDARAKIWEESSGGASSLCPLYNFKHSRLIVQGDNGKTSERVLEFNRLKTIHPRRKAPLNQKLCGLNFRNRRYQEKSEGRNGKLPCY